MLPDFVIPAIGAVVISLAVLAPLWEVIRSWLDRIAQRPNGRWWLWFHFTLCMSFALTVAVADFIVMRYFYIDEIWINGGDPEAVGLFEPGMVLFILGDLWIWLPAPAIAFGPVLAIAAELRPEPEQDKPWYDRYDPPVVSRKDPEDDDPWIPKSFG